VPPGRHSILVENEGADWCYVSYRLTNYLAGPNLRVLALSNRTSALLWVQNRDHTWTNHREGITAKPVSVAEIETDGFEAGDYEIEEWDTYTGTVVQVTTIEVDDGAIVVRTPDGLTTDVAYKIRRIEEEPHQRP